MSTGRVTAFPPSTESQVELEAVRPAQPIDVPGSGSPPTAEIASTGNESKAPSSSEDEVKLQFEPPGDIAVYQFVDQHGTLILQVPPQQMLDLARQISQELAQEAEPKEPAGAAGGKDYGR
jgi:hypothetical protein